MGLLSKIKGLTAAIAGDATGQPTDWLVGFRLEKAYNQIAIGSVFVKSRWPAEGNSLIHSVMGSDDSSFKTPAQARLTIISASNSRGPVGRSSEPFVIDTTDERFKHPKETGPDKPAETPKDDPSKS